MPRFPVDAPKNRVIRALKQLGYRIIRERNHICMACENKVTYATEHLTQTEIESVGYQWAPVNEVLAEYNPKTLTDGFNDDGFFYISEPGQGLWALRSRFSE